MPFSVLVTFDFVIKLQSSPSVGIVRQSVVFLSIVFILLLIFGYLVFLYNWNKVLKTLELRASEVRFLLEEIEPTLFKPSEASLVVGKYGLFFVLQVNRDVANFTIRARQPNNPEQNTRFRRG